MPETTQCPAATYEGNETIRCELPAGHGPINVRECARIRGDSDWEMHAEGETSDHAGGGGFWNQTEAFPQRISAEQVGDTRVEYLREPTGVEIRIAALQATATIWQGRGGFMNKETLKAQVLEWEQFILAAPQ